MKQILLYNPIMDCTAEAFIEKMFEYKDEDISCRMNCPGGSVFAGWGMCDAAASHEGEFNLQVDGHTASMGAYFTLFAKHVTALDVSKIMFHRASGRVETQEDQDFLDSVNSKIREKMEERIDPVVFESVAGFSIAEMFEAEESKDVWLTAKQAKDMGLVHEIKRLTTSEQQAMSKMVANSDIAANIGLVEVDNDASVDDIVEALNKFTEKL